MPRNTSSVSPKHQYRCQDFIKIRDWCLNRGLYFEDPYFHMDPNYEWRRPWEITSNPQLFVDGASRFDVVQGDLGDCWMVAAITTLAMQPNLVRKVIPSDQSFSDGYAGIFHFRFWQFGTWYDVVVDDRLPTVDGKLTFTRSASPNEFWSALFEKAYCKILGDSYSVGESGNLSEALEDFTGGVVEQFHLHSSELPRNFQQIFLNSIERHSLVGCFIDNDLGAPQTITPLGLVRGHSYSVTGAKSVKLPKHGDIVLVRLRNPWGRFEWKGPWSDHSPEWKSVSESTRKSLGIVQQDDGEFWMSYDDFKSNFQWVDMCHLNPDAFSDSQGRGSGVSTWNLNIYKDNWVIGITDGGSKAMYNNPQVRFTLRGADAGNSDGVCSVLIALIQKTTGRDVEEYNEIGFKVFSIKDPKYNQIPLDKEFFAKHRSIAQVATKRVREVAGRFDLNPGIICVIPYTYEAGNEGEFILRIYSEKRTVMDQVSNQVRVSEDNIEPSDVPPMSVTTTEGDDSKSYKYLKEYFNKVSNGTKEVGWKGLKDMLDYAIKNDAPLTEKGWGSFIMGIASYAFSKIFEPTNKTVNAYLKPSVLRASPMICVEVWSP